MQGHKMETCQCLDEGEELILNLNEWKACVVGTATVK